MAWFDIFSQKAVTTELTVDSSNGFHLRPVAQFVTLAKSFDTEITASFQGKKVNAKTVNSLLSLSLEEGDTFTLECKGKKAQEALEALTACFDTLMHKEVEVKSLNREANDYQSKKLEGEIIYAGIAIAPIYPYSESQHHKQNGITFEEAMKKSFDELETLYVNNKEKSNADIYLAQKALLSSLKESVNDLPSLESAVTHACQQLLGSKLEAKISDYKDLLQRVKYHLGYETEITFPNEPFILLADDLLPSQVEKLSKTNVQGVILKETSLNSHTAILLRGEGITSLIVKEADLEAKTPVIVDAHAGVVIIDPDEEDLNKAKARQKKDKIQQSQAEEKRFEQACTLQGKHIKILANVTDETSAKAAKEAGAEGIGLLRTEFLFKKEKPSFEMQVNAYRHIFSQFDEITIRTLDVGGDKALPYITLVQEENPFLGIRGVRLFNTHPDIIKEQLHAIFTAAEEKPLKVMFPMVSSVEEFVSAKAFAHNVAKKHRINIDHIAFGIMIEVPSVLFMLDAFNAVVDFYSIGTNDLTQYLFAIERTHATLKTNDLSPAVFHAIKMIADKTDKPLSICGELAGNEKAIPTLIEIGIDTLSVSVKNIAKTKEFIRNV